MHSGVAAHVGIVHNPRLPDAHPVTTRRWEAWKKGPEDYRTLAALRERGVAQAVLDQAVEEALSATGADGAIGRLIASLP